MPPAAKPPYAGYRFPAEIISHAVWLDFRFPLSLRMVDEILAARGIEVVHEPVRQWARKFGQSFANQIRRRLPRAGDKWPLDEVEVRLTAGRKSTATPKLSGRRLSSADLPGSTLVTKWPRVLSMARRHSSVEFCSHAPTPLSGRLLS